MTEIKVICPTLAKKKHGTTSVRLFFCSNKYSHSNSKKHRNETFANRTQSTKLSQISPKCDSKRNVLLLFRSIKLTWKSLECEKYTQKNHHFCANVDLVNVFFFLLNILFAIPTTQKKYGDVNTNDERRKKTKLSKNVKSKIKKQPIINSLSI